MAERLADLVMQIENVGQLGAVVTAMRGIATSRAQKGRALKVAVEAYTDVISLAISQALGLLSPDKADPPPRGGAKRALILFCAEQGFAGAFSERVLDAAAKDMGDTTNLLVGMRGAVVANQRGIKVAWSTPMATRIEAIPAFANKLAQALYRYVDAGTVAKVDIVVRRSEPGAGIGIDRRSLLPVDFGRFARQAEKPAPLITFNPQALVERLASEYVYAQLCQAAVRAFEAENEARVIAMASAKSNIETKLSILSVREGQLRQEEITTEIVELAAGAAASPRTSGL